LVAFHDVFSDEDLQRFRADAEQRLLGFAEVIIEGRRPGIKERAIKRYFSGMEKRIIDNILRKTRFLTAVLAGLYAWGITVIIILLGILVINWRLVLQSVRKFLGVA
jgi:hypothetical protein